jgi:hypothetical protein
MQSCDQKKLSEFEVAQLERLTRRMDDWQRGGLWLWLNGGLQYPAAIEWIKTANKAEWKYDPGDNRDNLPTYRRIGTNPGSYSHTRATYFLTYPRCTVCTELMEISLPIEPTSLLNNPVVFVWPTNQRKM